MAEHVPSGDVVTSLGGKACRKLRGLRVSKCSIPGGIGLDPFENVARNGVLLLL